MLYTLYILKHKIGIRDWASNGCVALSASQYTFYSYTLDCIKYTNSSFDIEDLNFQRNWYRLCIPMG